MSNVPMTLPELVISEQPHIHSHTTTWVELDDGRIFLASFQVYQYSEDRGLTWSPAQRMKDINGDDVGGSCTCLVKLSQNKSIGLVAQTKPSAEDLHWEGRQLLFWRSDDNGETWQLPTPISPPDFFCQCLQDVLLRTSSGRIILPVFGHLGQPNRWEDRIVWNSGKLIRNQFVNVSGHYNDPHFAYTFNYYSDDDGRTWHRNKDGELMILRDWSTDYSYVAEPTVTEVVPGRLLMFMRNGLGRLFQAWSNDDGETWTRPQPTVLAASTTPAQLRTLPNGHLLCIWNQASEQEVRQGYTLSRISSAISRDGGRVWEFFQNIDSQFETTRVEPGPIRAGRPEEIFFPAGQPAVERDPQHVTDTQVFRRAKYPSVLVMDDRVIVAYSCQGYLEDHPTESHLVHADDNVGLKILPLKWFYGGKEPADNPFLKAAYEPAKP